MTNDHGHRPLVWSIAGSDPGSGAGIQADLKTFQGLEVYGCTIISALTVQNTTGVFRVAPVAPDLLREQVAHLAADLPPVAIKLGMLGSAAQVRVVADFLATTDAFVVCDPVLASTGGVPLLDAEGVRLLRERILPRADLVTPNVPELGKLLGPDFQALENIPAAAAELLRYGARAVLVKGGHGTGEFSADYFSDGRQSFWLTSPRQNVRHTHGTGCTLASAIAAARALGHSLPDALVIGKAYLNQGLRLGEDVGQGHGPLAHRGWPETPADLPMVFCSKALVGGSSSSRETQPIQHQTRELELPPTRRTAVTSAGFPDCGPQPVGFYPIVDRAAWLEKLLPLGVTTIQLRAKNLTGTVLENEIRSAIEIARRYDARLFINDAWELALKHGAYGVHLGQDDLAGADLPALARAGVRLGISTHNYFELAVAAAYRPSYIAIGPVFATASKTLAHMPLGLAGFRRLARLASAPVVAIGGLTPEHVADLRVAGARGFAVIGDIVNAPDPVARVCRWQQGL
ncbi:MAG: bifunctional hydroxymethylpyrimidine kinase/phosphomethylpyrimidine kinase [Verrucomicrobia bacterium]|nr:MAG: bifunctional hydroxymethylpyrimidine kinase/phosphomethylpyrimidine kinase [Verrucomicrobiota bacterium]